MNSTIRASAKRIIEGVDTKSALAFDFGVQGLILLSLVTFAIETLPNLTETLREWLNWIEVATVLVFTAEYVLRLWVADNPLKYATSFFGIVDLLSILPFYLALGIDLRTLRVLRFMRLFRVFKLGRYSRAIQRLGVAFQLAKEEIFLFFFVSMLLLYLAAVGIYYFESEAQPDKFGSIFHSLWWAICTLTTVGYGDVYPITVGGRLFTFMVLLIGMGIVAVPAGVLASALLQARRIESEENPP